MSKPKPYTDNFYQSQQEGSLRSAEEIAPLLKKLVDPKSVIDIGCGVGAWLSVFKKLGVEDIQGVDGNWVSRSLLKIPAAQFLSCEPLAK
jgi:2-polyprenyl-3-methyl-5-hydroxy-6-metoxy-1,4-benzoquinol methylase